MTPSNVRLLISVAGGVLLVGAGALLFFLGVPDQGTLAVATGLTVLGGLGTALAPGLLGPRKDQKGEKE